jgi:hypothetical protein
LIRNLIAGLVMVAAMASATADHENEVIADKNLGCWDSTTLRMGLRTRQDKMEEFLNSPSARALCRLVMGEDYRRTIFKRDGLECIALNNLPREVPCIWISPFKGRS